MQKSIIIFVLFLIFGISPVFAAVNISVGSYPSSAIIGQEFTVSITANDLSSDISYYLKGRIGTGTDLNKAETNNSNNSPPDDWLSDTDSWSKFPIITSGETSTWSGTLKLRAKNNATVGQNILRIRLKKTSSDTTYNSEDYSLNLEAAPTATPTLSPTATITPTPRPNDTPTPTPSNTPKPQSSPTNKPSATPLKVSPTITQKLTPTPEDKDEIKGIVLGESVSTPSSVPEIKNSLYLSLMLFLIGGGLIFISIAIFIAYKQRDLRKNLLKPPKP